MVGTSKPSSFVLALRAVVSKLPLASPPLAVVILSPTLQQSFALGEFSHMMPMPQRGQISKTVRLTSVVNIIYVQLPGCEITTHSTPHDFWGISSLAESLVALVPSITSIQGQFLFASLMPVSNFNNQTSDFDCLHILISIWFQLALEGRGEALVRVAVSPALGTERCVVAIKVAGQEGNYGFFSCL